MVDVSEKGSVSSLIWSAVLPTLLFFWIVVRTVFLWFVPFAGPAVLLWRTHTTLFGDGLRFWQILVHYLDSNLGE
jgi:hypothetical protein